MKFQVVNTCNRKKERNLIMDQFLERYPFKYKPFDHQAAYLQRFWEDKEVALFAEMGTGKSFMLINNACMLYDKGKINAMLIVAPKGVYRNWYKSELPKHMPDHVSSKMACWSPNPRKAEKMEMEVMLNAVDDLRILIMNIEAFSTEKGLSFARTFLRVTNAFMAIDECTTIKNPSAKRTKGIIKVGRDARYRRIATGSPVTKSPLDLYSQCEFLGPDCLNSSSYYAFQARYAILVERKMATHTFKQIVGYRRLDELQEKMDGFAFRVTKEECLDLPDKVYTRRDVELTAEQKKAYDQMKLMALAEVEGGLMTTNNALTQLMRLHQIVCGHGKFDDGQEFDLPSNRVPELLACLAETGSKVIIWANYRKDIEKIKHAIQKEYGMTSVATYFGDTNADDRQDIVTRFQDPNDDLRFFVGNPRTGGYGLTLTAATVVIYYSNSFDLEVRLQSEDRAHRIGQTEKVTYIDLITPDTVDEHIVKALRNKINIASQVLGEDLKEWLI
jgi:SNF2 family DNA or RNA helicase